MVGSLKSVQQFSIPYDSPSRKLAKEITHMKHVVKHSLEGPVLESYMMLDFRGAYRPPCGEQPDVVVAYEGVCDLVRSRIRMDMVGCCLHVFLRNSYRFDRVCH